VKIPTHKNRLSLPVSKDELRLVMLAEESLSLLENKAKARCANLIGQDDEEEREKIEKLLAETSKTRKQAEQYRRDGDYKSAEVLFRRAGKPLDLAFAESS